MVLLPAFIGTLVLVLAAEPPASDLDRLQGTWTLSSMEREGEAAPADELQGSTVVYEGNRMSLRDGDRVRRRGIITLAPERTPKAINTWDQDGPYEDQTVPGIYELEGDTLRICFARPGQDRPKQFTTKSGTGVLFCVYKKRRP
jgi:uncharacterized protein (TIGR03067 family)